MKKKQAVHTTQTGPSKILQTWGRKGQASTVIKPFNIAPGDKVVLLCRVSSSEQGKNRNLDAQEIKLREAVEERGGEVVGVVRHEWSGRGPEWEDHLIRAAGVAEKSGAILLAATTDRIIRSLWYKGTARYWTAQAQQTDLWDVKFATEGVEVQTFLHPDATPHDCRSLLTRWGREVKEKKGGRPKKIDREPGHRERHREMWFPLAVQLREQKMSIRKIADEVTKQSGKRISITTIHRWIRDFPMRKYLIENPMRSPS